MNIAGFVTQWMVTAPSVAIWISTFILANQCGALTANGTPCKRYTIRGGTRCTLHGGGSPEAKRVAEEMLAVARVPAARVLLQIIEDWEADRCGVCGRPSGDAGPVIRAAMAVLDRAGMHPSMSVQVSREPDTHTEALHNMSIAELIVDTEATLERLRELLARQLETSMKDDVIVVEVYPETESLQLQDGYSEPVND